MRREWDENDVKMRPAKGGSRPRTKRRPEHAGALQGRVIAVDRGRYTLIVQEGIELERTIVAARARELHRRAIVVGDCVDVVGDTSGAAGSLARIVRIGARRTVLRRSADDTDPDERVMVANVDQLMVVVAVADPQPRYGFIDRALLAAYDAGIAPIVVLTKTDLASPRAVLTHYQEAGVPVVSTRMATCAPRAEDENAVAMMASSLEAIRRALVGKTTVLLGQSGVGKSTLVNALTGSERAVGSVNTTTGRGRHTSSSALALPVQGAPGTWMVDTPGVRSFGLAHIDPERILAAFPDIAQLLAGCPRRCSHGADDQACALASSGPDLAARLSFFRRLYTAASGREKATPRR